MTNGEAPHNPESSIVRYATGRILNGETDASVVDLVLGEEDKKEYASVALYILPTVNHSDLIRVVGLAGYRRTSEGGFFKRIIEEHRQETGLRDMPSEHSHAAGLCRSFRLRSKPGEGALVATSRLEAQANRRNSAGLARYVATLFDDTFLAGGAQACDPLRADISRLDPAVKFLERMDSAHSKLFDDSALQMAVSQVVLGTSEISPR